jgi:mersacidin/lichenicidin family type 2 lantibiotic
MKKIDIARAFRDEDYFLGLSEAERASLGSHPSGPVELGGEDLHLVSGSASTAPGSTILCTPCPGKQCGA